MNAFENPVNSRRQFLRTTGQGLGSLLLASQLPAVARAQDGALADPNALHVPEWDEVPECGVSSKDAMGQGPFFIHEAEKNNDVSLFRQDIRGQYNPDAEPGIDLDLHLRFLDAAGQQCSHAPVEGVIVYLWHCDAQGYYSGFGAPGEQQPDVPYNGSPGKQDLDNSDRFCRGAALTDANGVVSFRSVFPGWYNGRDVHVHFMVMLPHTASRGRDRYRDDGHLLTGQFYFHPELIDTVHKSAQPYLRRTTLPDYYGAIQGDEPGNSGLHAKASFDGKRVVAQMQVRMDPQQSVTRSNS